MVIAEGVEDGETWSRMRGFGTDGAQGFLVSRPLPIAALPIWFRAWQSASGALCSSPPAAGARA